MKVAVCLLNNKINVNVEIFISLIHYSKCFTAIIRVKELKLMNGGWQQKKKKEYSKNVDSNDKLCSQFTSSNNCVVGWQETSSQSTSDDQRSSVSMDTRELGQDLSEASQQEQPGESTI